MNKQPLLICAVIFILLALNFLLKPYLRKRDAARVVETVLRLWQKEDAPAAFDYWKNMKEVPPVYGIISYQIEKKTFQQKDGKFTAQFFVLLEFPPGNLLPSNKLWIFALEQTSLGWKVTSFELAK